MYTLKNDHPYLFKRVLLKAVIHMLFGLILLHFPAQAPSLSRTPLLEFLGVNTIGILYLIIASIILVGLFKPANNYSIVKFGMWFAALFNITVFVSLFAVFFESRTTAFFMVIYGYMTYNIYHIAKDPGWRAIQIIKNLKQDATDIQTAKDEGASKQTIKDMNRDARLHQ